jgi:predicted RNA-binding protein YlqC (UPF0109 family)
VDRSGQPQVALVVPNSACGCVIGKGGSKIRSFVEDSGADIKLSNQDRMLPGCNDRTLTITGSIDGVLRGVALVATTLCEDASYSTLIHRQSTYSVHSPLAAGGAPGGGDYGRRGRGGMKGDETSILVTIPDSLIGAVLGRGGRTIAEIQVASGCRIKVSDRDDFFEGTRNRKVIITGSAEGVQMANYLLTQKLSTITTQMAYSGSAPLWARKTTSKQNNSTSARRTAWRKYHHTIQFFHLPCAFRATSQPYNTFPIPEFWHDTRRDSLWLLVDLNTIGTIFRATTHTSDNFS